MFQKCQVTRHCPVWHRQQGQRKRKVCGEKRSRLHVRSRGQEVLEVSERRRNKSIFSANKLLKACGMIMIGYYVGFAKASSFQHIWLWQLLANTAFRSSGSFPQTVHSSNQAQLHLTREHTQTQHKFLQTYSSDLPVEPDQVSSRWRFSSLSRNDGRPLESWLILMVKSYRQVANTK